MNIISGQNVDLITPFPAQEAHRTFGWNHCYRTILDSDDLPRTQEEFTAYTAQWLLQCPAWGIIDKNHITSDKHEAPLVGVVMLEVSSPRACFIHFAAGRKAFKMGLVEEALRELLPSLFADGVLLRVGCYLDEKNTPAKALFRRLGFRFEGAMPDMCVKNGEPRGCACFGLTRRAWESQSVQTAPSAQSEEEVYESAGR